MTPSFKDFPHYGVIGDSNDAKLLTVKGIEDYFVAEFPDQKEPAPRKMPTVQWSPPEVPGC